MYPFIGSKLSLESAKSFQDQYLYEYYFNDDNCLMVLQDDLILCTCSKNVISKTKHEINCKHIKLLLEIYNKNVLQFLKIHNKIYSVAEYLEEYQIKNTSNSHCMICLKEILQDSPVVSCKKCNSIVHKSCYIQWFIDNSVSTATCIVCKSDVNCSF